MKCSLSGFYVFDGFQERFHAVHAAKRGFLPEVMRAEDDGIGICIGEIDRACAVRTDLFVGEIALIKLLLYQSPDMDAAMLYITEQFVELCCLYPVKDVSYFFVVHFSEHSLRIL